MSDTFYGSEGVIIISFLPHADGSDFASVEKNALLFKGFGSINKESVAELFVSLMSKASDLKLHFLFSFVVYYLENIL